ncbi:hypothetical protein GJ629_12170 [Halapricum sp. CBA1109]|uniref:hypothetical protein n=1 Tax=Halapricum sp. CBA1109 TaxID=2668068 RepID=UPI0012FCDA51|nr:hypothetical protein [Halapricum sp. CBA1109]MUV90564.1 hypothetical protein [Halapricum sp. CBA1109]
MARTLAAVPEDAVFLLGAGAFLLCVGAGVGYATRPLVGIVAVAVPGSVALGLVWAMRSLSMEE